MKIPSIKLADPIDLPTVVVDVVVTLDDQVRFSEHMRDRPEIRRRRHLFLAIMLLAGPPIGMLAGFLAGPDDPSLSQIVRDAPTRWWLSPVMVSLLVSGVFACVAFLLGRARRPLLRRQIRRVLADRPGIDPQDPELRERCRCAFDAQGYSTQGQSTRMQVDWSVVRGLDEAGGRRGLRIGPLTGFILPLRNLSGA